MSAPFDSVGLDSVAWFAHRRTVACRKLQTSSIFGPRTRQLATHTLAPSKVGREISDSGTARNASAVGGVGPPDFDFRPWDGDHESPEASSCRSIGRPSDLPDLWLTSKLRRQ